MQNQSEQSASHQHFRLFYHNHRKHRRRGGCVYTVESEGFSQFPRFWAPLHTGAPTTPRRDLWEMGPTFTHLFCKSLAKALVTKNLWSKTEVSHKLRRWVVGGPACWGAQISGNCKNLRCRQHKFTPPPFSAPSRFANHIHVPFIFEGPFFF